MSAKTLDKTKPFGQVVGAWHYAYTQDGKAFNTAGEEVNPADGSPWEEGTIDSASASEGEAEAAPHAKKKK